MQLLQARLPDTLARRKPPLLCVCKLNICAERRRKERANVHALASDCEKALKANNSGKLARVMRRSAFGRGLQSARLSGLPFFAGKAALLSSLACNARRRRQCRPMTGKQRGCNTRGAPPEAKSFWVCAFGARRTAEVEDELGNMKPLERSRQGRNH